MATKYADRAFINLNGAALVDLQSSSLKQTHNARAVKTMTRKRFNRGFVQGNTDIDITFTLAIDNLLARPKLESIAYDTADVGLSYQVGADLYTATGLFLKDNSDDSSGIGDESKGTFNMGALELVDTIGNSVLFDIQL